MWIKKRVVVFFQDCEAQWGVEVFFFFFFLVCIVNLRGGVMNIGLCNSFVLRGLYHKGQHGTWVILEV